MELPIDPDTINKFVADAVLKSAIGDAVKEAVAKAITNLTRTYDNPLENVVRNHVAELAREVIRTEHGDTLRERMKEALAAKLSNDFIDRVCEEAMRRC